jgi:hypothetical protein
MANRARRFLVYGLMVLSAVAAIATIHTWIVTIILR